MPYTAPRAPRALFPFLVLLALTSLVSCATPQPARDTEAAVEVVKSPNDNRAYRYFRLDNGLQVLLVSDPDTDKAAASLVVQRGSHHDPDGYEGLAHFLEHMLFIGTEKYPAVDEYQQFVAAHGGSTNAYTAGDHTNYFFEIQPDSFVEGLDRFAQFFISPLLDPAYVEREKNAVHSEYQLQLKDDAWRGFAALKAAMSSEHPGSRFNIGSLETLGPGVDEALDEFLAGNYSADQMILVALSNAPLDELAATVRPMFGAIENRRLGPAAEPPPMFRDRDLPLTLTYKSLKNMRRVTYNFPIPPTEPVYLQKPEQYLTNLLGHEGPGSLHQQLKQRGWIESLEAGTNRMDSANVFLSIDIELTEDGAAHVPAITDLLFDYIELLEPEAWRYREQARMAELAFRFQEKSSPTAFVYRTAPMLASYPPHHVVAAPYLMEDFDPALIRRYLGYLTPDNLVMEMVGPDVETTEVEPWFQVPYRITTGEPPRRPVADAELALPERNPFIPERLALLPHDEAGPSRVVKRPALTLWLDRDTEFGTPRANVYLTLGVRNGLVTPNDIVLAQLYQRLVSDALNEYAYPALLAGLGYHIGVASNGFEIRLSGYDDKQPELLDAVLDTFINLQIDASRFELYRTELVREWRNFKKERPYTQTFAALSHLLLSSSWPPETLAAALAERSVAELETWRKARLSGFSVLGLAHGNVDRAAAGELAALIDRRLPLAPFELLSPAVAEVDESFRLEVPVDHQDASMVLHVQDVDSSFAQRARSALATQLLRQAYFTSLRTEQQLGYVVAITNRSMRDRAGLTFIVQSPVASAADLVAATRDFMSEQIPAIETMPDEAFAQHKAGLISRLTERDRNLQQRSDRYWNDLDLGVLSFDSNERIAALVADLTKADMLDFLNDVARRVDSQRLLIYNQGKFAEVPSQGTPLTDIETFKRG